MARPKLDRGLEKYFEFHQLEPKKVDELSAAVPDSVHMLGEALWITYRSGKWGQGVYDYIHDFGPNVKIALTKPAESTVQKVLPKRIRSYDHLVLLGRCLGFAGVDHEGFEIEAKGTKPLPYLCCSHDGRCLFVLETKKRISAIIWGGKMHVEARGIVN